MGGGAPKIRVTDFVTGKDSGKGRTGWGGAVPLQASPPSPLPEGVGGEIWHRIAPGEAVGWGGGAGSGGLMAQSALPIPWGRRTKNPLGGPDRIGWTCTTQMAAAGWRR